MSKFATTKLTSRGQIVIPETIRDEFGFKEGAQFMVFGSKDTVILKTIQPPSLDELGSILDDFRVQAKKAGVTKADLKKAINKVRSTKK